MRSRLVPVVMALVMAGAACGDDGYGDSPDTTEEGSGAPAVSATEPEPESEAEAEAAPTTAAVDAGLLGFQAPTVAGEPFDAAALAGRDVVVWFWSPWCGSCNREADGVGRVAAALGDDVAFIGIAGGAEHDEYEEFLADHDLSSFPQLVDDTGEIWARFGADVIRSSFFFLDDTGDTSQTGYGEIDEDALRQRAEALIAT